MKKDIVITQRVDLNADCENIWTQCQLTGKKSICVLFGSYYQNNASDTKSFEELEASPLNVGDNIYKNNVIIAEDFNASDIVSKGQGRKFQNSWSFTRVSMVKNSTMV